MFGWTIRYIRTMLVVVQVSTSQHLSDEEKLVFGVKWGAGKAQRLYHRTRDRYVPGSSPRTEGEFSSPGSTFCADSYFGIRRPTPVLPQ